VYALRRRLAFRRAVLSPIIALALSASACLGPPDADRWRSELADAEARWRAAAITSYQFTVLRQCACSPAVLRPVTVTVRAGVFSNLVHAAL